jgi:signal transduction histidine kinase/ligand-binding sensor domain-containing protein
MSKRVCICAVWLAAYLAAAFRLCALDESKTLTQYAHRIWGQEEGLLQPTVYSILQSRDGFLWLATQDSLVRFDGMHFKEFEGAAEAGLQRTLIRSLAEDAQGDLWVASLGSGAVRIRAGRDVKRFTTKEGMPSGDAFCVEPDSKGATWVCTASGLVRIGKDGRLRVYSKVDGLPTNQIRDTCVAADGTRWVTGLDFGMGSWDGEHFQPSTAIRAHETTTALACTKSGSVWVGTAHGAIEIHEGGIRRLTVRDGLPDNEVLSLIEGPDGTIWIGTNDGITRFRDKELSVYRTRDGLSHSVVLSLFIDREGSLWAGTKDGLDQFSDGKVTPYSTNEGLVSNDTGPVLEDSAGRLWVGTFGHGLSFFDGRRFRTLTKKDGLLDDNILSLQMDRAGDLWVGSKGGLNRLRKGKVVASFTRGADLTGQEVRALSVDAQGVLWAGSERGLDRLEGNRFRHVALTLPGGVVSLNAGRSVRLFISTDSAGFSYLKDGKEIESALDITHPVVCSYIDMSRKQAWLGTNGSGLLHWKNGAVTRLRVKDGLFDNRIYSVLRDDEGRLWMASSKGIFRVSEQEIDDFSSGKLRYVTSIPFSTGQLRFECRSGVQPAACRTRDGRLWFSTTNGLVVLDPRHLADNVTPPPTKITSIVVNGQRREPAPDQQLQPLERNVELRYAGLSFVSPEKVTFRYMLDGFEKTWTDAGSRREAFFTNLPPGHFSFHVMARNADGVWSRNDAVLRFTVKPRLYQRPWFFPTVGFLIAGIVAAVVRLRIARLRHRFDEVLAERNRIARELHDTLLQGLSGITMQLQALWTKLPLSKERTMLGDIIQDAARCSTEARQSLWGLRTIGVGSLEFSVKLQKLARDAAERGKLALLLRVNPISLAGSPEVEYQLLRIAQEALNNVVQHAGARRLEVQLEQTSVHVSISIQDDGAGFDAERQRFGHFGLVGMQERAREIGAQVSINSQAGHGTTLTVIVPLRRARLHDSEVDARNKVEHLIG